MKTLTKLLMAGVACGALLSMSPAHAGLVTDAFCGPASGKTCEGPNDQMVFLQKADDVTTGFGNVGGPSNSLPQITITSDGGLLNMQFDLANGFATITPANIGHQTTFNGIDVFAPTGYGFTDLVFDVQLTPTASSTDSFTVQGRTNGFFDLPLGTRTDQADQDAEYSITAFGAPGEVGFFSDVNILSLTGFDEIKHLEVSLCAIQSDGTCTQVAVPEPESLALLGSGIVGMLGLLGWRRRRDDVSGLAA